MHSNQEELVSRLLKEACKKYINEFLWEDTGNSHKLTQNTSINGI